jgi:hypothetical protein
VGGVLCTLGLLLNAGLGHPQVWVCYVLAIALAAAYSLSGPTGRSAVPFLLDRELYPAAMALKAISGSVSWLLGPALAGVLLAAGGTSLAYALDAASFGLAAVILLGMRALPPIGDPPPEGQTTWRSVLEGLSVLRRRQPVMGSFLVDINAMVFGMPAALFPAVVDQRFDGRAQVLGLLYAAPFAGSLVASATSGWSRRIRRHGMAVTVAAIGWGIAIAVFGLVASLWATLLALALAGGADMVSGIFRQTILALDTPPEMMGRMEGVGMAVWTTGPALGDAEAGIVAALTSVQFSIVSGGVLCAVGAAVIAKLFPGFLSYRVEAPQPAAEPAPA